ncbi:hypothetical protein NX059_001861 [Plenodomus lindquistii]|nr:hypothetical protein NX059_001861 [Plenodomus lindquistii]
MNRIVLEHAKLGAIRCLQDPIASLVKVLGLPYGTIPQRFARSRLVTVLKENARYENDAFDATRPGASSIQPWGSVKSDASNIPLPTDDLPDDEEQSEDCLNLSIHLPSVCLTKSQELQPDAKLPVLVFIHGGAFFLGSANRPYYNPANLVQHAQTRGTPVIFVAINYRLGSLGFWHSHQTGDLVPENNGLYDQDLAFEWLRKYIEGFGGDVNNVTVIGQSAGGESISLKTMRKPLFKRAIMFSGTPVTMPVMTQKEHHENFLAHAEKLGIRIKEENGNERDVEEVAKEVISVDVAKIRELAWVGLPCSNSSFMPVKKPSMKLMKQGRLAPPKWQDWATPVEAQIVSTTTYDGGISYNMMSKDKSRRDHAKSFKSIAHNVLGVENGDKLCEIYGLKHEIEDLDALQRICLFESDIGFFAAVLSVAESGLIDNTYLQIFDLPNPFPGPIHERGAFATHTFDIVTLLGGVHEDRLSAKYAPVILQWRDTILDFVVKGTPPCPEYLAWGKVVGDALLVDQEGVREVARHEYMSCDEGRRSRLFALAEEIAGDDGWDVLWVDVCRRFLMRGE